MIGIRVQVDNQSGVNSIDRRETETRMGGSMPAKYTEATQITETFCPGNGTRYELSLLFNHESKTYLFCWVNAPGHGRAMVLQSDGLLHYSYLGEKLNHRGDADLAALLVWIRKVTERQCGFPPDFDIRTGLYSPGPTVH